MCSSKGRNEIPSKIGSDQSREASLPASQSGPGRLVKFPSPLPRVFYAPGKCCLNQRPLHPMGSSMVFSSEGVPEGS